MTNPVEVHTEIYCTSSVASHPDQTESKRISPKNTSAKFHTQTARVGRQAALKQEELLLRKNSTCLNCDHRLIPMPPKTGFKCGKKPNSQIPTLTNSLRKYRDGKEGSQPACKRGDWARDSYRNKQQQQTQSTATSAYPPRGGGATEEGSVVCTSRSQNSPPTPPRPRSMQHWTLVACQPRNLSGDGAV